MFAFSDRRSTEEFQAKRPKIELTSKHLVEEARGARGAQQREVGVSAGILKTSPVSLKEYARDGDVRQASSRKTSADENHDDVRSERSGGYSSSTRARQATKREPLLPPPPPLRTKEASTASATSRPAVERPGSQPTSAPAAPSRPRESSADSKPSAKPPSLPATPRPRESAAGSKLAVERCTADSGVVELDACGTIFRVLAKMIQAKPDTDLAKSLASSGRAIPIFVDANPDRFACLLDWFRYGEIHVPKTISIEALLLDCHRFGLPDPIIINGRKLSLQFQVADQVSRDVLDVVINGWAGFQEFFNSVLNRIRGHYLELAKRASTPEPWQDEDDDQDNPYDFTPYVMPLYEMPEDPEEEAAEGGSAQGRGWLEPTNVSSVARARVLALKLEECGFRCSFTESDLVVQLKSRLSSDIRGAGNLLGEEVEEDDVDDDELPAQA